MKTADQGKMTNASETQSENRKKSKGSSLSPYLTQIPNKNISPERPANSI